MPFRQHRAATPNRLLNEHPGTSSIAGNRLAADQEHRRRVGLSGAPSECARALTVKHHKSLGTSSGSFNSSTSLTMGYSFWHRIFSDFWSKDKSSLRVGGTAVHDVPTASLADAVGSWQPLFEHWKQGKLTRRLLSEDTGSQDVERFLSTARAVCPAHSVRSSLSLCCSSWSSRVSPVSGGVSPGYAHSDDTFSPVRSLVPGSPAPVYTSSSPAPTAPFPPLSASSPILSLSTTSQTTSRAEAPLASSRQRGYAPDGHGGSSDVAPSRGLRCLIPQTLIFRVSF